MDFNALSAVAASLSALVAAAALLVFVWEAARNRRITQTLNLYERFHAPEMLQSRIRAEEVLKEYIGEKGLTLHQLAKRLLEEDNTNADWEHVSRVRHFLAQLQILRGQKRLDDSLAGDLFGEHVKFWFERHFDRLEAGTKDRTPHWLTTREALSRWAREVAPYDEPDHFASSGE